AAAFVTVFAAAAFLTAFAAAAFLTAFVAAAFLTAFAAAAFVTAGVPFFVPCSVLLATAFFAIGLIEGALVACRQGSSAASGRPASAAARAASAALRRIESQKSSPSGCA